MQPSTEDIVALDIVALTQFVWASVLDLSAAIADAPFAGGGASPLADGVASLLADGDVVAGSVSIDGPWMGTVTVACPAALATTIAARMYKIDRAAATDVEVVDAVGEIANMIGGNVKAMLPGPSSLSLPSVVRCSAARADPAVENATRWTFATDGQPFSVSMVGSFTNEHRQPTQESKARER